MIKNCFTNLKDFSILIGVILGLIGIAGGYLTLIDKWKNRKPKLNLFVPYNWSGVDTGANKRFLNLYLRISNSSNKSAFLYLETLYVEVKINGKWFPTEFFEVELKGTDFPEAEKERFGIGKVEFLKRFNENVVTYDKPLCGYISVTCNKDSIFESSIEAIKVEVYDCHERRYILHVDLNKQLEKDPYRKYEKKSAK